MFIVFEGGEGSGKSTQAAQLADAVSALGQVPLVTREPGGSPLAERIRDIILDDASRDIPAEAEALLFAAARADHVAEVIRPALARGDVVICDRYIDSSAAYQGAARGLGVQRIRDLSMWATGGLAPDLTVVLDVDPAVGLARARDANRLERESREFHRAVRAAFLGFAAADPDRYTVVSAGQPAAEVGEQVWRRVAPLMEQR